MVGFKCPFCNEVMAESRETFATDRFIPTSSGGLSAMRAVGLSAAGIQPIFQVYVHRCPACKEDTISIETNDREGEPYIVDVRPKVLCRVFPAYIPEQIRRDYEEAAAIINLSPKAAATLLRRCLQGMIRDFWGISKSSLFYEIKELQDKVPAAQW